MDELGVHAFYVGQHQQLFDRGVLAHVAVELGVGIPPLLRGLAEQGDVEQIGLGGVGNGRLSGRDDRRDQVGLDRVRVDAVVELGEGAVEIPGQREAAIFVLLEALDSLIRYTLNSGLIHIPNSKAMSLCA